jgi:hypothetical protein
MMGLDRSQLYRRMKALGIANRVWGRLWNVEAE